MIGNGLTFHGSPHVPVLPAAFTLSGVISDTAGNGGFSKEGDGTIALTGKNTYGGPTTVNQGTLSVANLGDGGIASNNRPVVRGGLESRLERRGSPTPARAPAPIACSRSARPEPRSTLPAPARCKS